MNESHAVPPAPAAKRRRFLIITAVAVLLVLLTGVEIALRFKLSSFVRRIVIAKTEEQGLKADVRRVSATLMGFRAAATDISIRNPPGFTATNCVHIGEMHANADLLPLLLGTISLSSLKAKGLTIAIERNEKGEMNMAALQTTVEKASTQGSASAAIPRIKTGMILADCVVEYADMSLPQNEPRRIAYTVSITATNIRTTADNRPWGTFQISGHINDQPGFAVADLRGVLAPLKDPAKPSFDIEGTILTIPLSEIPGLPARRKLARAVANAKIRISCREGTFCAGSHVSLSLANKGDTVERGTMTPSLLPSSVTVDVPVRGTIKSPEFRIMDVLSGTLLNNAARGIDSIARGIGNILGGRHQQEKRNGNTQTESER